MIIGNLIIQMSADLATLTTDMNKAKASVTGAVNQINGILKTIGLGLSFKALADLVVQTNATTASFVRLGEVAGTTAENMSKFELAARLSGTSLDTVATSIARLSRSVGEARLGDPAKKGLLAALGLDITQSPEKMFEDLARTLGAMDDKAVAATVSTGLLGRSYAEMRPIFEEIIKQGKLVATATQEQSEQAKLAEDNWKRFIQMEQEAARSLVADLVPAINKAAEAAKRMNDKQGFIEGLRAFGASLIFGASQRDLDAQIEQMKKGGAPSDQRAASSAATADAAAKKKQAETAQAAVLAWEKFLKDYEGLVAQAKASSTLFIETTRYDQALIKEAYARGNLTQEEVIQKTAELEDARLLVLRRSLEVQQALETKKLDFNAAKKTAEQINLVDLQRINNDRIAEEERSTVALLKARTSRAAGGKAFSDTDQFIDDLAFRREVEQRWYDDRLRDINVFATLGSEEEVKAQAAREQLAIEHRNRMVGIAQDEWQSRVLFAQFTNRDLMATNQYLFGVLGELMQSHSRRMFQVGKVAAIANTIISTYEGAQKAFTSLVGIPGIGYALAVAASAAAIAVGLQRVQAIQATQFGGGGVASPTYSAVPGSAVPAGPIGGSATPAPSQPVTINVSVVNNGNIVGPNGATEFVQEFVVPGLQDLIDNRDVQIVGVGSRQASDLGVV